MHAFVTFPMRKQIKPCLDLVCSMAFGHQCWLNEDVGFCILTENPSQRHSEDWRQACTWNTVSSLLSTVVITSVSSSAEQTSETVFNGLNNLQCIGYALGQVAYVKCGCCSSPAVVCLDYLAAKGKRPKTVSSLGCGLWALHIKSGSQISFLSGLSDVLLLWATSDLMARGWIKSINLIESLACDPMSDNTGFWHFTWF